MNKKRILFLSLIGTHSDYIADALFYGLKEVGHEVIDLPKRECLYKDSLSSNYYKERNLWHGMFYDKDFNINKRTKNVNVASFDYIICDNAKIVNDNPVLLSVKNKLIVLQTNDPFTRAPLPNIRVDFPMAIKEKCLQDDIVNRKDIIDFPINHTVPEKYVEFVPREKRELEVFFSMSIYGDLRKQFADEFTNLKCDNPEQYFYQLRKHKYGISIIGEGYNCQRDAEIAGNCVLCKYKHPTWTYDETSFRDGINCIEFSSLQELKDKIKYYNEHTDEYDKILKAGFKHVMKYLTSEIQAERLLEWKK